MARHNNNILGLMSRMMDRWYFYVVDLFCFVLFGPGGGGREQEIYVYYLITRLSTMKNYLAISYMLVDEITAILAIYPIT